MNKTIGLLTFILVYSFLCPNIKAQADDHEILMCWADPWILADTSQWIHTYHNIDIIKIYIDNIADNVNTDQARRFIKSLILGDVKIAIELGGLLNWHASKGNLASEYSFKQEYEKVKPLIDLIKDINPGKSINILDMDGPIRRMLFPNNQMQSYHTIGSAVKELFEVVKWWQDSIPGIEINLLTNFPNWAWGSTPAYFNISGEVNGYGHYDDVIAEVKAETKRTGLALNGITIDNPYSYAMGTAPSNQTDIIEDVDWMQRISELTDSVKNMGINVNMIFNTNGGRTPQRYYEQTLAFIDTFHQDIGEPDGYWIQSWYSLPDAWIPETEAFTMTNLTLATIRKLRSITNIKDKYFYNGISLKIFPNPVNSQLIMHINTNDPGNCILQVYNMQGLKTMIKESSFITGGMQIFTVDVNTLPAGLYSVYLEINGEVLTGKFIKTK